MPELDRRAEVQEHGRVVQPRLQTDLLPRPHAGGRASAEIVLRNATYCSVASEKVCCSCRNAQRGLPSRGRIERLLCPLPPRLSLHVLAPVRLFGSEQIVRSAKQSQIVWFRSAAFARWLSVVQLQPSSAATARAVDIHPAATETIAFEHCAARGKGNVRPMGGQRRW